MLMLNPMNPEDRAKVTKEYAKLKKEFNKKHNFDEDHSIAQREYKKMLRLAIKNAGVVSKKKKTKKKAKTKAKTKATSKKSLATFKIAGQTYKIYSV